MRQLLKISRILTTLLVPTFAISACSNPSASKDSEKVSLQNGLLEIDILPGSFSTDNCGMEASSFNLKEYACVAFPFSSKLEKDKNWDAEYLSALDANGWKWAGGESNAIFLEKPASNECSYSLLMLGWFQGSSEEIQFYFNTGKQGNIVNQTYIFSIEQDLKCGKDRRANK